MWCVSAVSLLRIDDSKPCADVPLACLEATLRLAKNTIKMWDLIVNVRQEMVLDVEAGPCFLSCGRKELELQPANCTPAPELDIITIILWTRYFWSPWPDVFLGHFKCTIPNANLCQSEVRALIPSIFSTVSITEIIGMNGVIREHHCNQSALLLFHFLIFLFPLGVLVNHLLVLRDCRYRASRRH